MKKQDFLDAIKRSMKKDPTEQDMNFIDALAQGLEDAMGKDAVERKKQIDEITQMIGTFDEGKSAASVIRAMAQRIEDIEKKASRGLSADDKYKLRAKLEEKKDEIIRARNSNDGWAIEFKASRAASALMTTATVLTGATAINNQNVMDDMDITVIQYPKNFVIDMIGGRQVAKVPAVLRWKEQLAESDGVPAKTNEGAAKPLTDKLFAWKTAARDKYAGRIEFSEELAMDFDQLLLQIIDMFEQQVVREWNKGVQAAIVAWAPAYTTSGLDGYFVAPGVAEVIKAGKLAVSNNNYDADVVMINPVDAAKAMIHQTTAGEITYIPEAIAFDGLTPFISTHVPAGTILVGVASVIKEQHSSFIARRGMYGDQLIENEETIIGEVFSLLKLPTESKKGWVKLVTATVLTALTKS
jgi:hypothetical protein